MMLFPSWFLCSFIYLIYIAGLLHVFVRRIISLSLKFSSIDIAGDRKTISRLIENVLTMLPFIFFFWSIDLSILGLPVSSLLAGVGIME